MGGNRASDATGNPAPNQISLAKSLLIIGAATALGFLIGDSPTPDKEDEPFGESQSRQEPMQTQLKLLLRASSFTVSSRCFQR
jgi:hypothetical protein